ncbi:MAG: VCBS repeat-containing protein [Verrucomicrobia bacterium]|nr:VCBS repeat-containing protein [Verrucomicrobiota bacterium]
MFLAEQSLAKRRTIMVLAVGCLCFASTGLAKPWKRHTIDSSSKEVGKLGADGVRLADVDGDGLPDITTGWEQGGAIVVYRNPGAAKSKSTWPSVTVGMVRDPEDAVFIDLDGDGKLDVVSSCEGRGRTMYVHWAPTKRGDYWRPSAWQTKPIPATQGKQLWMFATPAQIDGVGAKDLFVSSKGGNATIGWLRRKTDSGRNVSALEFIKLRSSGWVMSLEALDMDADDDVDLLFSDRKGPRRGVGWLENPGGEKASRPSEWREHMLGGEKHEVMFLDVGNVIGDPAVDIVCTTRNKEILFFERSDDSWKTSVIPNPMGLPNGKAVAIGDVDGDGQNDLVHTTNTGGNRSAPGVTWLKRLGQTWQAHDISGNVGVKFDLIKLADLDGDGDLDAITCEEVDNLGVFWYENPHR